MKKLMCFVLILALCGTEAAHARNVELTDFHHLFKRQAQTDGTSSGVNDASSHQQHTVSQTGDASSQNRLHKNYGQWTSSRKQTKTHRTGLDTGHSDNRKTFDSERRRTYSYALSRDRSQNSLKTIGITESSIPSNRTNPLQSMTSIPSSYDSASERLDAFDLDSPLQDQPSQQSNYNTAALYEAELRRRQELRRRHEEERQRRLEERRRLEEERRRQEEDRRTQEEERRRQEEERRRQRNDQDQGYQQQSQTTAFQDSRQNVTSSRHSDSSARQQPLAINQEAVPRTGTGYQHRNRQASTNQQSGSNISSSDFYQPHRQSVYNPGSGSSISQQAVYRTNHTDDQGSQVIANQRSGFTDPQGRHIIPNQRSDFTQQGSRITPNQRPDFAQQVSQNVPNQIPSSTQLYNQQPAQVDPRLPVTSQRGTFPGFRTRYEYGGQGQSQWYPYQETGDNYGSYYPFGDQDTYSNCPDTGVDLRINGLNCQQAVQQFGSSLCYTHEYTSRLCCEVCRPRKQPSRIGCEYGDHAQQCSSINPADCYDLRNRQICCETCERLRRLNTPPGCEYGDMTIRCETVRQNPGLCYRPDNQRICCETCSQTRNASNPGCPWGDYDHNVCQVFGDQTNNARINCYSQHRRRLCCQSCGRLREWLPSNLPDDCQYGDRPVIFSTSHFGRLNCSNILNYFSVDECRTNPAVYVNCCYTCHRYLSGQG